MRGRPKRIARESKTTRASGRDKQPRSLRLRPAFANCARLAAQERGGASMGRATAGFALMAGLGIAVAGGGSASAADLKCGLSNGKAASGAPIVIGGIVSITGPDNFSFSGY